MKEPYKEQPVAERCQKTILVKAARKHRRLHKIGDAPNANPTDNPNSRKLRTMRYFFISVVIACIGIASTAQAEETPAAPAADILANLRAGHPRLILTPEVTSHIQSTAATDPQLAGLIA